MLHRACRKTPLRVREPLSWPIPSLGELFFAVLPVPYPFLSPVDSYQVSHQLVQIERENRPGAGHLQRLPEALCGLVESIFVRFQRANDAFGLAPFAPDRLTDCLGNVPCPLALGLDTNLFDPLVGQCLPRGGGIASPIVNHQGGSGMRTKDGAVLRQGLQGHLGLVDRAAEQRPKDVPTAEATQQVWQTKLHLLASFVADNGAC